MNTRNIFLTAALIGLTATATSTFAGHCASGKSAGTYGYGPSPMGYYRPAIYQRPRGYNGYRVINVGHHMGGGHTKAMTNPAQNDIVDIAMSSDDFTTLVAAVKAAGLVDTLKADGPYTVFAPTNEAFAKIPKDQLDALLQDKDALTKVLTYHVVPGKVMAADVTKLSSAKTVQGQSISIDTRDGVKINNARVIKTDIVAENGVIHVIDTVILPN